MQVGTAIRAERDLQAMPPGPRGRASIFTVASTSRVSKCAGHRSLVGPHNGGERASYRKSSARASKSERGQPHSPASKSVTAGSRANGRDAKCPQPSLPTRVRGRRGSRVPSRTAAPYGPPGHSTFGRPCEQRPSHQRVARCCTIAGSTTVGFTCPRARLTPLQTAAHSRCTGPPRPGRQR